MSLVEYLWRSGSAGADVDGVAALEDIFCPEEELRFFADLLAGEEQVRFGGKGTAFDVDRFGREKREAVDLIADRFWQLAESRHLCDVKDE